MRAGTVQTLSARRLQLGESARATCVHLYVTLVALGAGVLSAVLLLSEIREGPRFSLQHLAFFVFLSYVADRYRIQLSDRTEISAGFLADFLSGALLGPFAAVIVSASAMLSWYKRGEVERNAFHLSAFVLCAGLTAVTYWEVKALLPAGGRSIWPVMVAGLAAGTVYQVLNGLLFVPIFWLRRGFGPLRYLREAHLPFVPYHYFFLLLSVGFIIAYREAGALTHILFTAPLFGLIYAFRSLSRERELSKGLETFSLQIIGSMMTALDMKDNYTAQHSAAVAHYSYDIAHRLGMKESDCRLAHKAGLLHDLGKISVPDMVLNRLDALADRDWEVIKQHPEAGEEIVKNVTELRDLSEIILHHHERYDGTGYPGGLLSNTIPLMSRIVAVADAYSAMISDRPYRPRMSDKKAIDELMKGSGSQFDPDLVKIFVEILEREVQEYRLPGNTDFGLEFQKMRLLEEASN
jgi:putative nucleotidyltransferase with HDIG domain